MTSSNKSGEPVLKSAKEIREQLSVDAIFEGIPKGEMASTIVDCTNDYKVVRVGLISQKMIDETIGR